VDDGLELRVFGAVEVWQDGTRRAVGGPKPRMLLALLLAHRGAVVSSDRLCEELWGDDQPSSPRAVLQSHVSRLRRLLEPETALVVGGRSWPAYAPVLQEIGAFVVDDLGALRRGINKLRTPDFAGEAGSGAGPAGPHYLDKK